jgi:hypothetical protein
MAIYTRFGGEVTICEARLIPVWVVKLPAEIKWFYSKPTRRFKNVREMPFWHYRGVYTDIGNPVCDGKWCDAANLVADSGWQEIDARLIELCPDGPEKYQERNKADAPAASHFFPPISERGCVNQSRSRRRRAAEQ